MSERQYKYGPRGPRAKRMLPGIQQLVQQRATQYPTKDRYVLANEIINEIGTKWPSEIAPTEDTLVHRISKARNSGDNPLNHVWTLATLESHPLPSDAVPALLHLKTWLKQTPLTIRQARWIARLHHMRLSGLMMNKHESWETVWVVSYALACYEDTCEATGTMDSFDTAPFEADDLRTMLRKAQEYLKENVRSLVPAMLRASAADFDAGGNENGTR